MSAKNITLKLITIGLTTCLGIMSSPAFAAGFALWEYNGADVGNVDAGGGAIAEDASTGFTNPAGLVRLPNAQVVVSADPLTGDTKFHGYACGGLVGPVATPANPPTPAGTISNACNLSHVGGDNGGTFAVVPSLHVAVPVNDRWFLGLSVVSPFGLSTDYGHNTPIRYSATKSNILSVNFNPNVAFKFNNHWSVGAGFDAMYFSAVLNQSLNLFPNGASFSAPPLPTFPIGSNFDAQVKNQADDWGFGWNVGALYQIDEHSRIGLSYRSQIVVEPTGTSKIYGNGTPSLRTTHAVTNIKLPPSTMLSGYHMFNPQWAVMGTVIYTQWSTIQNIALKNSVTLDSSSPFTIVSGPTGPILSPIIGTRLNPVLGTVNLPQKFRNTWRAATGADYMPSPNWRLRAGVGFDQTPVQTAERTPRLPDANRWLAAIGAGYIMNQNIRLDAGYQHVFIGDATIRRVTPVSAVIGTSDNSGDVFGLQATFTFT